jgi:hypothetical protein
MPLAAALMLWVFVQLATLLNPAHPYSHLFFLLGGMGSGYAIVTGAPAAAFWLGLMFLCARPAPAGRSRDVLAGAMAGLAHSAFAFWITRHPPPHAVSYGDVLGGGALMLSVHTFFEVVLVTLATTLAGAVSGLLFSLFRKNQSVLLVDPRPG